MMDRRTFLVEGAKRAGIVALVVVATGSLARAREPQIRAHLRAAFPYLSIDDSDLDAFAAAYVEVHGHPTAGQWPQVEESFLLSTDFFLHDADESVPVHFVTLYDPYVSPCFNPLVAAVG